MMRGQWAESEIRKELSALEAAHLRFTFNRIPDAHGGFMQPAAADFQWFYDTGLRCSPYEGPPHDNDVMDTSLLDPLYTRNGLIEAKEVEHMYLLKHGNFGADKIARMVKRQLAGAECIILVAHKLKGMRKPDVTWRSVPLQFFADTVYEKGVGSWDLREFPLVDMPSVVRGLIT